jgi:serine/threonine protein kinase/TolA-binding protein
MADSGNDLRVPDAPARRFRTGDARREGVTSVSFFGTDPDLNVPVVVKVLRPSAFPSPLERQRVVRELKRQVSVPHPSLARVIAADEESGVVWVARDWIEGQPLSERIARGDVDPEDVARWTSQLAEALSELHRVMLLHRDVRPEHVILALDGRARLIDASCGRFFRGADGKPVFGTPGYVAPEAIAGKLVNARSDLYSLGATAFAMLMGAPPFGTEPTAAVLERAARSDAPRASRGPEGLVLSIASLLAREPRERPFHAQQVVQQLEPFFTATRNAAAADDDDGPPTAAVDEGMVSKAIAVLPGPAITDDQFDDAEATEVGRTSAGASSSPAASSAPFAAQPSRLVQPPPRGQTGAMQAPPASNTGSHAVAVAPSASPAMAVGQPQQSVIRKATLMGIAPVPSMAAPIATAPSTDAAVREDSGPRRTDFDDDENTVVSEDSRIFGHTASHAPSAHGTAVPPLPDDVSKRVLQKGGAVNAPVASRPQSVAPPPAQHTGALRAPAPSLSRQEPVDDSRTMTANIENVRRTAGQHDPHTPSVDSTGHVTTEDEAAPPWVASSTQAAQAAMPVSYPQPHYAQPSAAPLQPAFAAPDYPAHPSQPTGAFVAPAQPYGAGVAPQPGAYPTGPYVAPQPYGPRQPTGAYPVPHAGGTAAWAIEPKKPTLLPWLAAGCLIAVVAGGTGYGLALRHRGDVGARSIETPSSVTTPPARPVQDQPQATQESEPRQPPTADASVAPPPATGATSLVAQGATPQPRPATPPPTTEPLVAQRNAHPPQGNAPQRNGDLPLARVRSQERSAASSNARATSTPAPAPAAQTPLQQARGFYARSDYVAARAILESWVRAHPSDAPALLLLGDVRFAQGERRPAGDAYRAAIAAGGHARQYWQRLVDRQISIGDRQGAINTLNDVLRHRPGDADATRALAEIQGGPRPTPTPAPSTRPSTSTSGGAVPAFGAPRAVTNGR